MKLKEENKSKMNEQEIAVMKEESQDGQYGLREIKKNRKKGGIKLKEV